MTEIKWLRLDNSTGERSLKQHGFIANTCRMPYTREEYPGNISLCGKIWSSEDGETAQDFKDIEPEVFNEQIACGLCVRIAVRLQLEKELAESSPVGSPPN